MAAESHEAAGIETIILRREPTPDKLKNAYNCRGEPRCFRPDIDLLLK
jgi:hypothetical protein